jgi:hypothetical protein
MMKRIARITRILASACLIASIILTGYYWMILGIRRCYFPEEPIIDLLAVLIPACIAAIYFSITIWHGRYLWMIKPKNK